MLPKSGSSHSRVSQGSAALTKRTGSRSPRLAASIIRCAMTSSTIFGWPVSSNALQAASKASTMAASASESNSPGVTKERIDIAATPHGRADVNNVPLKRHNQVKTSAMEKHVRGALTSGSGTLLGRTRNPIMSLAQALPEGGFRPGIGGRDDRSRAGSPSWFLDKHRRSRSASARHLWPRRRNGHNKAIARKGRVIVRHLDLLKRWIEQSRSGRGEQFCSSLARQGGGG
jgi:hypothetical protein